MAPESLCLVLLQLHHLLAALSWASYITLLHLSFIICKMGIIKDSYLIRLLWRSKEIIYVHCLEQGFAPYYVQPINLSHNYYYVRNLHFPPSGIKEKGMPSSFLRYLLLHLDHQLLHLDHHLLSSPEDLVPLGSHTSHLLPLVLFLNRPVVPVSMSTKETNNCTFLTNFSLQPLFLPPHSLNEQSMLLAASSQFALHLTTFHTTPLK